MAAMRRSRGPADPASASDAEWFAYVYLRDNPRGPHRELWFHEFGCEQWIEVARDTLTHEIAATRPRSASMSAQSTRSAPAVPEPDGRR